MGSRKVPPKDFVDPIFGWCPFTGSPCGGRGIGGTVADTSQLLLDAPRRKRVGIEYPTGVLFAVVLGVPVEAVSFAELRTDGAHLDALRAAVAADLPAFDADGVDGALTRYLGSSIHVRSGDRD